MLIRISLHIESLAEVGHHPLLPRDGLELEDYRRMEEGRLDPRVEIDQSQVRTPPLP